MDTFEKHFREFPKFLSNINSWHPDYLVPVAKKGGKLLKASGDATRWDPERVKYRVFFELNDPPLKGQRVAVFDDATQYTSTLFEYRTYFENRGAIVRTFSFVGHDELLHGVREKYDQSAEIWKFLPEAVYQEYIVQQAFYLLNHESQYDLDHLIFEVDFPHHKLEALFSHLRSMGQFLFVERPVPKSKVRHFILDDTDFFGRVPYLSHRSISTGPIRKIKFIYNSSQSRLIFSPLVFPTWKFDACDFGDALFSDVPIELPFKWPRWIDKTDREGLQRTYYNIWCIYAISLAKAFLQEMGDFEEFRDIHVKRGDIDATQGVRETSRFIDNAMGFLYRYPHIEFTGVEGESVHRKEEKRFTEFGEVLDHLKKSYAEKARKRKSRVGFWTCPHF